MNRNVRWTRLTRCLLAAGLVIMACNAPGLAISRQNTPEPKIETLAPEITSSVETATSEPLVSPVPDIAQTQSPRFARFDEPGTQSTPSVAFDAIAPDLNNVSNPFVLSRTQLDRLARDGIVVSPGTEKEFFTLYEKARYDNLPVFVTSDSMLHSFHLLYDKILRTAEREHFIPLLRRLNQALLAEADLQYTQLLGSGWEDAALRTVAFLGVGSKLLDSSVSVPAYSADLVNAEIAQIEVASGILPSPIFPGLVNGEDYTQYIPRGHYTLTEDLKAYFKSMMWYGRMTFRLRSQNPEVGRNETRSALLLVHALHQAQVDGRPAMDIWADLYSPTVFFVGRSDDLTAVQYTDVINYVYGENPNLETLVDESKLSEFIDLADTLPPPKILGIVIEDSDDVNQETKGMRFMGQRFVPDAYIFRQLIYRNVGTQDQRRGLPKGLDIMAAMGSERAYQILDQSGDTQYLNYPSQMEKVRSWLSSLTVDDWTETLYNTWLYTFFPLLEPPGQSFPSFMRSQAWLDKQLNASLGSWAELKHDTILYAKQVYAELGGGPPPPPPVPPKGYVEPVPRFFARLTALTTMTRTGLESRGLLTDIDRQNLMRLENLCRSFQLMAEKELRGEPLSEEEFKTIRFYGGELEQLAMLSAESQTTEPGAETLLEEEQQAAVIADVATDPDPSGSGFNEPIVLQVGVGRINELYAVAPIINDDRSITLQVTKGGVFSYYEFPWPASDRLTDKKWRQMLEDGSAPAQPGWMTSYMVQEGGYTEIGQGISNFQKDVTFLYWDPANASYSFDAEPVYNLFRPEIESLIPGKFYVGHQLQRSDIRSVDIQSPTIAVVTVRETWLDTLYQYSGDYPEYNEQPIKTRGPYSLNVTYTLNLIKSDYGDYWKIVQAVYANQPPPW